jgi:aryl-alcohol dehydrogenase-like predicted oxidoreductase
VVPLAGTSKRKWLDENVGAVGLEPSEETLRALDETFKPGIAQGDRYPAPMMARLGL